MNGPYDPRAHGAQCDICPLKTCKVVPPDRGQISDLEKLAGTAIAVVGEAPGEQEERQGRPFVGPSGDEMDRALRMGGIRRRSVHMTTVLLCRPPGNRLRDFLQQINRNNRAAERAAKKDGREPPVPIPSPIDCCAPRLEREIEPFEKFITLGGKALLAVTGITASLMAVRGGLTSLDATLRTPARQVMPTLQPSLVMKQQRWAHVFRSDIAKAGRWFRGQANWIPPRITYHPSPAQLRAFLADRSRIYTFDLETNGIESLTAKIRCVGIGFEDEGVIVGILGRDGVTKFYPPHVEKEIIQILCEFFADTGITKAGHNAGYYDKIVLQQQWGVTAEPIIDTMLLHRSVESELPHGLAYVGSMYTEAPSWKTDREGNKLSHDSETDAQLHEYCANDVAVTARVISPLVDQVGLRQQVGVWQLDQKMQAICADMHTAGMYVDQKKRLSEEQRLLARRFELLNEIRDRLGRPQFNPGSVYQVRDVLFDSWQLQAPLEDDDRYTAAGDPSTADLVLRSLLTDRCVARDQREVIKLLRYYRKVQKVLGTYVVKLRPSNMAIDEDLGWDDGEEWSDKETRKKYGLEKKGIVDLRTGRMHPGYNAHVAVCVVPETWVLGVQGPLQIGSLPFGPAQGETPAVDLSLHDGSCFAAVSHLQNPGVCPTMKVELVLGIELIGTPHHRVRRASNRKFLRQDSKGKWRPSEPLDEWVRLDALAADYVKVPIGMDVWGAKTQLPQVSRLPARTNANEIWLPSSVDEDLGLFMGAYTADGSLHDGNGSFSIRLSDTTGKPEMDLVEQAACRLFGPDAVSRAAGGLTVTSVSLAVWCEALEFGRGLQNKRVPSWVLSAPKPVVLSFIKGLSLDSNITLNAGATPVWHYSGSKELAQSLQMLLLNLGIPAGLQDERTKRSPNTWGLAVCGDDVYRMTAITGQVVPALTREGDKSQARPKYIRRGNHLWLRVKRVSYAGLRQVYDVTIPTTHQFWANGTVSHNTGRLSSSKPINAQNFPKAMRGMIIPAPGHVLVGADMDQLELRIAAARWNVGIYLSAFVGGKDPHSMTAFSVFGDAFLAATGLTADQFSRPGKLVSPSYIDGKFEGTGEDKKMRDLSKAVQYASQYMAKVETVHKLICKTEVPARGADGELLNDGTTDLPYALLPLKRVREMRDNWLKGAPEFQSGWDMEISAFRNHGFIAEPVTGRRRDFLDGEAPNEIVNFPIQASAAGLMNRAIIQLHEAIPLHKWGPGTGIINQCHDSIVVECPEAEAANVVGLLEECLNQTHPALPGVTFTASAAIGTTWKAVG